MSVIYSFQTRGIPGSARFAVLAMLWGGSLLPFWARAQNLVPNPGFEGKRHCPQALGNLEKDLFAWNAPTRGSTDYFHSCSEQMGTPENFNGRQLPYEGEGYSGFYAFAPDNYREYLQVQLSRPLEKGREYQFSAALSLSERSDYALASLGLLFSNKALHEDTRKVLSKKRRFAHPNHQYHFLKIHDPDALSKKDEWGQVRIRFTAKGTERYLIFGNFESDAATRKRSTGRSSNKGAYYYLDDMELFAVGTDENAAETAQFELDSLQTLQALLFKFDSSVLTEAGRMQLQDLTAFLIRDEALRLELRGHTDGLGSEGYNRRLSEARCRAVADFLQGSGVDSSRIFYRGYGSEVPVASNSSPQGRLKNRRVEFIIHSQ